MKKQILSNGFEVGAYWGFALMSLHLGIHWNMMISPVAIKLKEQSKAKKILFALPSFLIAGYGIYAFITRNIAEYMFLKNQFVFFDFNEPFILFIIDSIAIMGLFVFAGYYAVKLIKRIKKKK